MAWASRLNAIFHAVDSRLPVMSPMTLDAYTSLPLFPGRLATLVVGILAAGALGLSALGLYGITRFAVATRTREIGLRRALGARPADLLGLLVRDSSRFSAVGFAVGLALALATMQVLPAVLPRLRPDPAAVVAATGLLLIVLGAAVALAAFRALRIDPATALRDA